MNFKFCLRLLGPVIFLLIVYFYIDIKGLMEIFADVQISSFLLSLLFVIPLLIIRSLRWKDALKKFNIDCSLWKAFRIYFVEMVAIMLVAVFGTFIKIFYFKRDEEGLLNPCLSIIADKYFDYLLPLLFGTVSFLLVWLGITDILLFVILIPAIAIFFLPARFLFLMVSNHLVPGKIKDMFRKRGWNLSNYSAEILSALTLKNYTLSVLGFAVYFLSIYFISEGIKIDLNYYQIVIIMSIISIITLLPISFLGIGTRDVGLLIVFSWFGRSPEQAVAFSFGLLMLRLSIVMMGSVFWFFDPPPFNRLSNK